MAMGPRSPVAPVPAQPPTVGLLPTFRALADPGERWEMGFAFAPENCGTAGRNAPCDRSVPKAIDANLGVIEAEPIYLWAGDACAPFDFTRDRIGRARRQLEASESYQLANELWTGTVADAQTLPDGDPWPNRWLASPAADVLNNPVGDPAFSAINALGCLEMGIGECAHGARGVIHATRQLASIWAKEGMLRREGAYLLTIHDTFVVADAGYPGTGPAGQAAADDTQWAYATGIPQVRLGPVKPVPDIGDGETDRTPSVLAQAMNRDTNLIEYRAERLGAVTWDGCCHLAVNVDLPLCYFGGTS